ncbi:hypothetical protein F5Y12DRAFT_792789 [Xylaria sp. FL1777]|nr:hypothetical protein F5Y12DRAFT_792789 [Xylaria sp. FL1777]
MNNEAVFQVRGKKTRNSSAEPLKQLMSTPPPSRSLASQAKKSPPTSPPPTGEQHEGKSIKQAENMSTPRGRQLKESNTPSIDEELASRLQIERQKIARQVTDALLPRLERIAAEAAEREMDKLIESARGETTREKIHAILARVNELPEEELETLFLRNGVMAAALRTVLRRVEVEEAVAQWEDIAPGR